MPTLKIQLKTKTCALLGDPVTLQADYVPRVGEILDLSEILPGESNPRFMVTSVVNKATNGGLTPYVVARSWLNGTRSEILEEYGWLPPGRAERRHDEEEMFG